MEMFGPRVLLRVEGGVLLTLALVAFWQTEGNWWLFALLFLAPDLSMLGYPGGARLGATIYNLFHNYLLPAILLVVSWPLVSAVLWQIGLIWFAHLGLDRLLGYGLKYPTTFKDTHLQRL